MKKVLFITLLFVHQISIAQTPTQIGGFALNTDIEQYKSYLKPETTLPIRFMEALQEVETQQRPGFKSGYIAYGTCAAPGKIVRIKLKYKESSKKFYEKLLDGYREQFGKPKWLGDPFHVISTWKWSFKEGDNQVEMYLQHNLSNKEEKLGNSIKMTMVNLVEGEVDCFASKNPGFRQSNQEQIDNDSVEFKDLIPK
jgi:hypothetical protein